jgi:hypothetical protein
MSKIQYWFAAPILVCGMLATVSYGNGINPPRPSGTKTVEATCTDRKTGNTIAVQRARITIDEPSGSLVLRVGQSPAKTLQLSQVIRLQISSAKPASDGFAKATIELNDPDHKGSGSGYVRLKAKGQPARLTGFTADLERIDKPLGSCKELTIQTVSSTEAERSGVSKK